MAKKKSAKVKGKIVDRSPEAIEEQAPGYWRETLARFFDENEVGMDAVWQGRELDDFDYAYLMSGYEVYSFLPGLQETGVIDIAEGQSSLVRFLRSKEALASIARLDAGSGSFRYALPYESDPA